MSLQPYSGEFTVSPIPLELSMNYCSHKCAYCFANLNKPGRTFEAKETIDLIRNSTKNKGLSSYLLREGYPVLISNRVDPFAASNFRHTLAMTEILLKNGNHIAWQTKGGVGIDEVLSMLDTKDHWYISIGFMDDDLRKKIEPGAPSINQRFELAEKLISHGHHVGIGINPLVEDWLPLPDLEEMLKRFDRIGIKDYWIETLHLNGNQIKQMSQKEKINIGDNLLSESKKRNAKYLDAYYQYIVEEMIDRGYNVFSMGQPFKSNYFNAEHEIYKEKTLKTHQDFINWCFNNLKDGDEIKWHTYYEFMKHDFYELEFSEVDGYAYRIARNIYRDTVTKKFRKLKDVLLWYWENPKVSKSIANNPLFQVVCWSDGKKINPYLCKENQTLIYRFNTQMTSEQYFLTD